MAVDSSLRQKHEEERLAWIASRIESYDAVEAGSDEVEKVFYSTEPCPCTCTRALQVQ